VSAETWNRRAPALLDSALADATAEPVIFTKCTFVGDPPAPFQSWMDWCASRAYSNVKISRHEFGSVDAPTIDSALAEGEAKPKRNWQAGDKCARCVSRISARGGFLQCNNCGWMAPTTKSREVMNPPADEAEAGNLANAAPRQPEHDGACRGETGMSSCPEARPVTATAQSPLTPAQVEACEAGAILLANYATNLPSTHVWHQHAATLDALAKGGE